MIVRIQDSGGTGYIDRVIHVSRAVDKANVIITQYLQGNDPAMVTREAASADVTIFTDTGELLGKFESVNPGIVPAG